MLEVVPLGGLGEFGMNMLSLNWGETTVVVDAGVMFPDPELLGVDRIIPDLAYLEEKGGASALVLTHGHEDHIGGVPHVAPLVRGPIYGTPLTLADDEISTRANNRFDAASLLATLAFAPARGVSVTAREDLFRKAQGVPGMGAVPAYHASLRTLRSLTQLEVASAPHGVAPAARLAGGLTRERVQSQDREGRLGLGRHDSDDRFR